MRAEAEESGISRLTVPDVMVNKVVAEPEETGGPSQVIMGSSMVAASEERLWSRHLRVP